MDPSRDMLLPLQSHSIKINCLQSSFFSGQQLNKQGRIMPSTMQDRASTISKSQLFLFKYCRPSLFPLHKLIEETMSLYQLLPGRADIQGKEMQGDYEDDNGDEEEQDLCSDDEYDDDDGNGEEDDLSDTESFEIRPSHFPPEKEKPKLVHPLPVKQSVKLEGQLPLSCTSSANAVHFPNASYFLSRPNFVSSSLPCSTYTSPQTDTASAKNMKAQNLHPALHSLSRQQSADMPPPARRQEMQLRKSKSCGDGRSRLPPEEFDVFSSIPRPGNGVLVLYECSDAAGDQSRDPEEHEQEPHGKDGFKCGAFCLFIPGLSKKKQAPANREEPDQDQGIGFSRVFSLEKFECGSWSSSAIMDAAGDDNGSAHSYFDLPLELIRSSADEANSPVKTAFIFERSRKGALKKNTSKLAVRKSHESSNRHVRFSTSAPVSYPPSPSSSSSSSSACITPRLLKAREEFNAFLEAQSA